MRRPVSVTFGLFLLSLVLRTPAMAEPMTFADPVAAQFSAPQADAELLRALHALWSLPPPDSDPGISEPVGDANAATAAGTHAPAERVPTHPAILSDAPADPAQGLDDRLADANAILPSDPARLGPFRPPRC